MHGHSPFEDENGTCKKENSITSLYFLGFPHSVEHVQGVEGFGMYWTG